jgi:dTDP-4-dehydrorhamnose 3,5-epimerase
MKMVQPTQIDSEIYPDNRGYLLSIYKQKHLPKLQFVEDRISFSFRNVLRGLHGDKETWKLVTCITGWFELIVVDARKESSNYGKWERYNLVGGNNLPSSVLIPPRFLNGHLVKTENAILHYKWTEYYSGPANQVTVRYDDPTLNINWHCEDYNNLILSERDQNGVPFGDINL